MPAVVAILVVVSVSVLIMRVGASALALTGLPRQVARFQARSAFLGVGFTTSESETVVNHPVRRRIVTWLILLGNIGVISLLAGVVLSFHGGATLSRLAVLAAGLLVLGLLGGSHRVARVLERGIESGLHRFSDLDTRDYAGLLRLAGDWSVAELQVEPGDWLAEHSLGELHLRDEGVVVLGITHSDGSWHGARTATRSCTPATCSSSTAATSRSASSTNVARPEARTRTRPRWPSRIASKRRWCDNSAQPAHAGARARQDSGRAGERVDGWTYTTRRSVHSLG